MPFGSEGREEGIGLALSGGGFRAVLFHAGSLIRLNELRVLAALKRISSVSGGSIVAGRLAVSWERLKIVNGVVTNLEEEVIEPLRQFCRRRVDAWATIGGAINPFKSAGDYVIDQYRSHLDMDRKLATLPAIGPRFVFNATNLATGVSFRFSREYCGDYRIGLVRDHGLDVASAVACSSAFPPVLSPIAVKFDPAKFERTAGADLYDNVNLRAEVDLTDGGVYDNMGLETVWGRYATVLVSDAGKPFEISADISAFAPKQILRVMDIGLNQALSLRKRMLIRELGDKESGMSGAYWGIGTTLSSYPAVTNLKATEAFAQRMSNVRTRLDPFNDQEQEELLNWGYALADAAATSYLTGSTGSSSSSLPFPDREMR